MLQKQLSAVENWLEEERERLPLLIPAGLGIGVAVWEVWWSWALWPLLSACLFLFLVARSVPAGGRLRVIAVGCALCIATGYSVVTAKSWLVHHHVLEKIWIGNFYGRVEQVEKLVARGKFRLLLATGEHAGLPARLRVNLSPEQYREEFQVGAIVLLKARLMPPAGPALPGGYDFARRAWFAGIGATGTALGEVKLHSGARDPPLLADARSGLAVHVRSKLSDDTGGIAAALATGDRGAISEADAKAMRESGMAHLLAISGLHVTAVVGGIFLFASRLLALFPWFALRFPIPIFAASIAAMGAVGYTLLTGAQVPTIRSCVAALLILTALILGREPISLRMVAAGAIFVLLLWPESLAGPSFQMSFAAVTTIILLHEQGFMKRLISFRESKFFEKILRGLLSLFLTGLAIELVLAPIALWHFHKAGLYGALANMAAIPLTTFIIMPFEALALLFDLVGMGAPFWWVVEQGLALILRIAHGVSALPGAVTMRPEMPPLAFAAMMLGGLWFAIFRTRARVWGLAPVMAGLIAMVLAPVPDLLVTGDGKHLALTDGEGNIGLLRAGAGDYVRDTLKESAGTPAEPVAIEDWPGAKCSSDICIVRTQTPARPWDIMATRTRNLVPSMELAAACKRVDIVISDRWLPYSCKPRWLKLDRRRLGTTGGTAIYLSKQQLETVSDRISGAPWAAFDQEYR
ncbi:MAG: ComEC/Rec2 family competence protein [Sphingorhabdus sp.]